MISIVAAFLKRGDLVKVKCLKNYKIYSDCRSLESYVSGKEYDVSEKMAKHLIGEKVAEKAKASKAAKPKKDDKVAKPKKDDKSGK